MSILTRYITREIVRHFCVILGLVVVIFLAVDFFEKFDSFIESGVPATRAFWYYLFKIPLVVSYMFPISLLLAILVTFGLMGKRNELIALKSSGVSVFRLFKPVAMLGILGTGALLILSEVVVPSTMPRANHIWLQDVKGGTALATREDVWLKGEQSFFKIDQYDAGGQVMYGLTVHYFDDQFRPVKRLDAKRGAYEGDNRWMLHDLMTQMFDPSTGTPDVSFSSQTEVTLEVAPDDLKQVTKEAEEMSSKDLLAVIHKIEAEGYDATRYRVDLQYKMAFPVVCLIMCLIAAAIAIRGKLKEGLPVVVSYGIGIAFLYYVVLSFCVSIGYGGILPPVAAAWSAHIIFLCIGGGLMLKSE